MSKLSSNKAVNVYRIISVDDSYLETKKIYVKVQMVGTNKTFDRSVAELYDPTWLEHFNKEDVALIAALYTAEQTHHIHLINLLPKYKPAIKENMIIIAIIFTTSLILANFAALKLITIGGWLMTAGIFFFPLSYIFADILTEVYGFNITRCVIWIGFFANAIVCIGMWLTTLLPSSLYWDGQSAYAAIYQGIPRIYLASVVSYVLGEFINSIMLAKLKIYAAGRFFGIRVIISSAIGFFIDTISFTHIAFLFLIPYSRLLEMTIIMFVFKLFYVICAIPMTNHVILYLKRKDHVDHYDDNNRFQVFSLKVV